MSRSELVHRLAEASAKGDRDALEQTMDLLVAEARGEGRHSDARRLSGVLRADKPRRVPSAVPARSHPVRIMPESVSGLLLDRPARRRLSDMILPEAISSDVRDFLSEQKEVALLRANSLEPRHAILLVGPPGNGKTSLAEVIAAELGLPFLTVRYDGVVDSFLGETATRIRRIIEYASAAPCVLFFDEFDAIGKERGDIHETGEIKRVVNSLLVQLDALPSHCIVVCATNHPELLDKAVWRRFELKIEMPQPGALEIARMYQRLSRSMSDPGVSEAEYVERMTGRSLSEIEQFNLDVRRHLVLSKGSLDSGQAVRSVLDRWARQFGLGAEQNKQNGATADRTNSTSTRGRKSHKGKKAAFPEQDPLPGTV